MNAVAALKALFAVQPRQFTPLSAVGTPRGRHDRHPLHSRKSLQKGSAGRKTEPGPVLVWFSGG